MIARKYFAPALGFGLGCAALIFSAAACSQELLGSAAPVSASAPERLASRTVKLEFARLAGRRPIDLTGVDSGQTVNFGVRLDEAVSRARLKLDFTYSPALITQLSHIKVFLNGQLAATVALDKDGAGRMVSHEFELDPRLFTDFNSLRFQLVGHYTLTSCEDPLHSSIWTQISPSSSLELSMTPLNLPNSLAMLPAPFFDRRDDGRLTLPMVMPAQPKPVVQQAAGLVASWFGAQASYHQARFPVSTQLPAGNHAVLFALKGQVPKDVAAPAIDGPTLAVSANPAAPGKKLLLVLGRNEQELQTAARALVLGKAALSGSAATVASVSLGVPRQPYDAPNWLPTDRPVRFGELVPNQSALQVNGYDGTPIRINLRVPADLSPWQSRGVPLDLKYRFTSPAFQDDSMLNVDINDQLVESYRLKPADTSGKTSRVSLPLLGSDNGGSNQSLLIPAFRVGSDNQLQFRFKLLPQKSSACAGVMSDSARAAIDPDSTIDFSGLPHFAALPNLAFFANSGYPFTRMADLSDSAIVMPDQPTSSDLEALASLFGHMGKWTGIPALRTEVVPASRVDSVKDKNLIVIGSGSASALLQRWGKSMPLVLEHGRREFAPLPTAPHFWDDWLHEPERIAPTAAGRELLYSNGRLAALTGFESPYREGLSVVALLATQPEDLKSLLAVLENPALLPQVRGDVAIVHDEMVESFQLGGTYYVGEPPFWTRIWFHVSRYPMLIAALAIIGGLLLAVLMFLFLGRVAAKRIGN
jgi:hypothetical protein